MTVIYVIIAFVVGYGVCRYSNKHSIEPLSENQVDMLWSECSNAKSFHYTVRAVERELGIK
jgi:hypothetical protein